MPLFLKTDVSGAPPAGVYNTDPDLAYELKKKTKKVLKSVTSRFSRKSRKQLELELERERHRFDRESEASSDSSSAASSSGSGSVGRNQDWKF